ncbi:unnamed protein product [Musa hybrid cultivar]
MLTWHDRVLVDFEGVPSKYRRPWQQHAPVLLGARERETEDQWEFTWAPGAMPGFPFPINIAEHWSATVAHGSHHRPHPPSFLSPPFFVLFGGGANPDRPPPLTLSVGPSQVDRKKKQNKQCSSFS